MFSLISGFITLLTTKPELKILIVGLDFSGKTALLETFKRLQGGKGASDPPTLPATSPTLGMNLARFEMQGVDVTFWDVGGAMHSIWDRYYADGACVHQMAELR